MKLGKVYRTIEGLIVPLAYEHKLEAYQCAIVEGRKAGLIEYIPKIVLEQSVVGVEEVEDVHFIHQKKVRRFEFK